MHIFIIFILLVLSGVVFYFFAPLLIDHFMLEQIKPNIDIRQIEIKIAELEKINQNLKHELFVTDAELSEIKLVMQDLSEENAKLKIDLAEQLEKNKKNISLLFN